MKVEWTRPALSDLIEAQDYIDQENPQVAEIIGQQIWNASQSLADNPHLGHPGHIAGTREWSVQRTPYLIVYRLQKKSLEILHVYHGKQNWQSAEYTQPTK